jgi:hypothetical protein
VASVSPGIHISHSQIVFKSVLAFFEYEGVPYRRVPPLRASYPAHLPRAFADIFFEQLCILLATEEDAGDTTRLRSSAVEYNSGLRAMTSGRGTAFRTGPYLKSLVNSRKNERSPKMKQILKPFGACVV